MPHPTNNGPRHGIIFKWEVDKDSIAAIALYTSSFKSITFEHLEHLQLQTLHLHL
jgi:hypothetical protein